VKAALRKDDILGRFGGEEFVIILPNTDGRVAAELAERIRNKHETHRFPLELSENGVKKAIAHRQTISMGVEQLKSNIVTTKDFLEAADKKVYNSKSSGRNKVTV